VRKDRKETREGRAYHQPIAGRPESRFGAETGGRLRSRSSLLALCVAGALSAPAYSADISIQGSTLGVTPLGSGIQGGNREINHVPVVELVNGVETIVGSKSQAVVIDFGEDITSFEFRAGSFQTNDGSGGNRNGCAERGRVTGFNASGEEVATLEFAAGDPQPITLAGAFQFVGVEALAYDPAEPNNTGNGGVCEPLKRIPDLDSSDFTLSDIRFEFVATPGPVGPIPSNGSVAPLAPTDFTAYGEDEPFRGQIGNLIGVDDTLVGEVVVSPNACDGADGNDNGECITTLVEGEFTSEIRGADVEGTFSVAGLAIFLDPNPLCYAPGITPPPVPAGVDLLADGSRVLRDYFAVAGDMTKNVTIPPELCGEELTPGGDRQFKVLEIESTLSLSRSVIELIDENGFCEEPPFAPGFPVEELSVIGWLPLGRDAPLPGDPDTREIPVKNRVAGGGFDVVNVVQDITVPGCGSRRSFASRKSVLLWDLEYVDGTDFREVALEDVRQLLDTYAQAEFCEDPRATFFERRARDALGASLRSIGRSLRRDRARSDRWAKFQLLVLRDALLRPNSLLSRSLDGCFYDLASAPSVAGVSFIDGPAGFGERPRNLPGDFRAQITHLLEILEYRLGVLDPAIPPESP